MDGTPTVSPRFNPFTHAKGTAQAAGGSPGQTHMTSPSSTDSLSAAGVGGLSRVDEAGRESEEEGRRGDRRKSYYSNDIHPTTPSLSSTNRQVSVLTVPEATNGNGEERRGSYVSTDSQGSGKSISKTFNRKLTNLTERGQNASQRPSNASSSVYSASAKTTKTKEKHNHGKPSSDVVPFLYQDFDDVRRIGEAPVRDHVVEGLGLRKQITQNQGQNANDSSEMELQRLADKYHARMNKFDDKVRHNKGVFARFRKKTKVEEPEGPPDDHEARSPSLKNGDSPAFMRYTDMNLKSSPSSSATASRKNSMQPKPLPSSASASSFPWSRGKLGQTNGLYPLDSNFDNMSDIVKPTKSPEMIKSGSSQIAPWDDLPSPKNETASPMQNDWAAPDSWGVKRVDTETMERLKDAPETESHRREDSRPGYSLTDKFFLRVFRSDNTFATVSCPLGTTAGELMNILGRKFFMSDISQYQIVLRKYNSSRMLSMQEKPLLIQKTLLEEAGYTEDDHIADLGREDHAYLCRFVFQSQSMQDYKKNDPWASKAGKLTHVDLKDQDIQAIPISLYQRSSEIISLDLSRNASVSIPSDFMQSCSQLRDLKLCGNEMYALPMSICNATTIRYLDASGNSIEEIPAKLLEDLVNLVSLKLQNNWLKTITADFKRLKSLRTLNLASNRLTEFPLPVCDLVTLVDLDLSFNEIDSMPNEIGQLCGLERFLATNNTLKGMLPITFANMSSLKELDLRFNSLTNVDVVTDLPRLEAFYINHNAVSSFEHTFSRLRTLSMEKNPVTRFATPITANTLTILNLSSAKIAAFNDSLFDRLPNVEKLLLDRNHFVSLSPQIVRLKKLHHLSCVSNMLASLPPEIGQIQELRFLDIHNNNIKQLPSEVWQLSNLATLNISSNLMSALPKPSFHSVGVSTSTQDDVRKVDSQTALRKASIASGGGSTNLRKMSVASKQGSEKSDGTRDGSRKDSGSSNRYSNLMSSSLRQLYAGDNRLTDDCFEEISLMTELRVLNLSYNDLFEVPTRALGRLSQLTELYLSGNELTSLPADDMEKITSLKVLHVNANKLQTLPAELGKIRRLLVLDVGSNSLKYNIANWPYDWNWNWNLDLKYLNLSDNKKLEIKPSHSSYSSRERNLSDFAALTKLRVLGLMDVTLTIPSVPDQTEDRRVRTSGSEIHRMAYGMADCLGKHEHLSTIDMVVERFRGHEDECIFGIFDGSVSQSGGSKIAKFLQEGFAFHLAEELKRLRKDEDPQRALHRTFLGLNKELGSTVLLSAEEKATGNIVQPGSQAAVLSRDQATQGCGATVVYMAKENIYVGNVGDAMAILIRNDGGLRLLTKRHDPPFEPELGRIRKCGGWVSRNGKVHDELDVSRSFGYFHLLPSVQAAPFVSHVQLSDQDDLLIIASKEVWEYMSHQMAVDLVRTEREDLMRAAQKLRDFAISYGASNKIIVMVIGVGDLKRLRHRSRHTSMAMSSTGLLPAATEDELFPFKKRRTATKDLTEDSTLARLEREVSPPVGRVALIFTDIKDSTLLWETQSVAMRSAIKLHNTIMRRQLRIVGGYEVKTEGDAFMVAFPTATSALLWCFSVQSQLLTADWPQEIVDSENGKEILDADGSVIFRGLSVRMGMHWGTPVCEIDPITRRMDYFGPMVNRASRISAVADGGQITVSADWVTEMEKLKDICSQPLGNRSYETIGDEVAMQTIRREMKTLDGLGYAIKELGERKLKGLENPEFISLVYAKSFLGRVSTDPHGSRTPSLSPTIQPNSLPGEVSDGLNKATQRLELSMDDIETVLDCVVRMELLCTSLADPSRLRSSSGTLADEERELKIGMGAFVKRLRLKARTGLSHLEILPYFAFLITRLENALTTLSVYKLLKGDFSGKPLSHRDLLDELMQSLKQLPKGLLAESQKDRTQVS